MKSLIHFAFLGLLASHVLLSSRPTEINAAVVFHAASLALLLMLLVLASARRSAVIVHPFSAWIVVFVVYFFTVGVLTSAQAGATTREVFEFPYRISNLLLAVLYPAWLTTTRDVRFVLRAGFALVLVQIIRDLTVGGMTFGSAIVTARLAGQNYGSLAHLAAPGFLLGWAVADWDLIRRKRWLQILLAIAVAAVVVKVVLMYARTVWFVILPADALLMFLLLRKKERRPLRRPVVVAAALVIVTGVGVLSASSSIRGFMSDRVEKIGRHATIKADEYRAVAAASTENVLLGKGFAYDLEFYKGRYLKNQAHVHNVVLQFLLSAGLIGLGVFVWGVVLFVIACVRLQRTARERLSVGAAIAVILTLSNFFMLGMVQSVFRREHTYLMLAVCIVLIVGVQRAQRRGLLDLRANTPAKRLPHYRLFNRALPAGPRTPELKP